MYIPFGNEPVVPIENHRMSHFGYENVGTNVPSCVYEKIVIVIARILMSVSAGVVLALGMVHLVYTFRGPKLTPRDPAVQQRMQEVSPVITSETTMWKTWIGFNATHSLGLMLFGLIYGYFAIAKSDVLFSSNFLLAVAFCMLLALIVLSKLYFFSVPFMGVCFAFVCYVASIVFSRLNLN